MTVVSLSICATPELQHDMDSPFSGTVLLLLLSWISFQVAHAIFAFPSVVIRSCRQFCGPARKAFLPMILVLGCCALSHYLTTNHASGTSPFQLLPTVKAISTTTTFACAIAKPVPIQAFENSVTMPGAFPWSQSGVITLISGIQAKPEDQNACLLDSPTCGQRQTPQRALHSSSTTNTHACSTVNPFQIEAPASQLLMPGVGSCPSVSRSRIVPSAVINCTVLKVVPASSTFGPLSSPASSTATSGDRRQFCRPGNYCPRHETNAYLKCRLHHSFQSQIRMLQLVSRTPEGCTSHGAVPSLPLLQHMNPSQFDQGHNQFWPGFSPCAMTVASLFSSAKPGYDIQLTMWFHFQGQCSTIPWRVYTIISGIQATPDDQNACLIETRTWGKGLSIQATVPDRSFITSTASTVVKPVSIHALESCLIMSGAFPWWKGGTHTSTFGTQAITGTQNVKSMHPIDCKGTNLPNASASMSTTIIHSCTTTNTVHMVAHETELTMSSGESRCVQVHWTFQLFCVSLEQVHSKNCPLPNNVPRYACPMIRSGDTRNPRTVGACPLSWNCFSLPAASGHIQRPRCGLYLVYDQDAVVVLGWSKHQQQGKDSFHFDCHQSSFPVVTKLLLSTWAKRNALRGHTVSSTYGSPPTLAISTANSAKHVWIKGRPDNNCPRLDTCVSPFFRLHYSQIMMCKLVDKTSTNWPGIQATPVYQNACGFHAKGITGFSIRTHAGLLSIPHLRVIRPSSMQQTVPLDSAEVQANPAFLNACHRTSGQNLDDQFDDTSLLAA